jgi:transposase
MEVMEKARSWAAGEEVGVAGGSQGARRATGEPAATPAWPQRIDAEVEPKAQRRTFSTSYKLQILEQADRCKAPGELGALLRREGLYASHLSKWRKQRTTGELGKKRGRLADPDGELKRQLQQMERENQRLQRKLRQAEIIIEVQKKASEILGITLAEADEID